MNPIIILQPDSMSESDIKLLRDNKICVVVAKDPNALKFLDPIPAQSSRNEMENAAISLSRKLLNGDLSGYIDRRDVTALYCDILTKGTSLDPRPTQAEQEKSIFDQAKREELQRLAREEAKADRAAAKASKTK
jgi:hypothetical protein